MFFVNRILTSILSCCWLYELVWCESGSTVAGSSGHLPPEVGLLAGLVAPMGSKTSSKSWTHFISSHSWSQRSDNRRLKSLKRSLCVAWQIRMISEIVVLSQAYCNMSSSLLAHAKLHHAVTGVSSHAFSSSTFFHTSKLQISARSYVEVLFSFIASNGTQSPGCFKASLALLYLLIRANWTSCLEQHPFTAACDQYILSAETWRISDEPVGAAERRMSWMYEPVYHRKDGWYMLSCCPCLSQNQSKLPMIYESFTDFSRVLHIATIFWRACWKLSRTCQKLWGCLENCRFNRGSAYLRLGVPKFD